jgi:predicted N-acetyltransferase YhbS
MSGCSIRRAVPADAEAVQAIVFSALRSFGIEPDPEGLDADVVRFGRAGEGSSLELVAEAEGRVIGAVAVTPRRPGVAYLSKLFVDQGQRGRGFGRALLDEAVREAKQRGYGRIELQTRTVFEAAVRLYEATGWLRGPDPPAGHGPDRTYYRLL